MLPKKASKKQTVNDTFNQKYLDIPLPDGFHTLKV